MLEFSLKINNNNAKIYCKLLFQIVAAYAFGVDLCKPSRFEIHPEYKRYSVSKKKKRLFSGNAIFNRKRDLSQNNFYSRYLLCSNFCDLLPFRECWSSFIIFKIMVHKNQRICWSMSKFRSIIWGQAVSRTFLGHFPHSQKCWSPSHWFKWDL